MWTSFSFKIRAFKISLILPSKPFLKFRFEQNNLKHSVLSLFMQTVMQIFGLHDYCYGLQFILQGLIYQSFQKWHI